MTNEIIESISRALCAEFGESYEIHMEEIKQGLEEPCFFISLINQSYKRFLGMRYFKENAFAIQYFPQSEDVQRECHFVAERMCGCLEFIQLEDEGLIQGTNMNYEVIDGALCFFVNYDCFIRKTESIEPIGALHSQINMKEE